MSSDSADREAEMPSGAGLPLMPGPEETARLADELLRQPPSAWRRFTRRRLRGQAAAVARLLCARSLEQAHVGAAPAVRCALAGLVCARSAKRSRPRPAAFELQAEAWGCLANARRVAGELQRCASLWRWAFQYAGSSSQASGLRALLLDMKASWRRDQRHYVEAARLLQEAAQLYGALADHEGLARVRLKLGTVFRQEGQLSEAFQEVSEALRSAARASDGCLFFLALHQHALILSDLGQKQRALVLAEKIEPFYFVFTGEIFRLRGLWLKGKLHSSQRQWRKAERYLHRVRLGFLGKDLLYDAALVALDLALVYAEQGQYLRVRRLAGEMYPVFRAQQIPRESAATLDLFYAATVRGQASAAAIAGFIAELEAKRRQESPE